MIEFTQPISSLFRKNEQFSSILRECKIQFSILFVCCNKAIQIRIPFCCIEIFFGFLDYTPGIELINRDIKQKREYHFQKINYVFLCNV